jgi:hypothetical protein
MSTMLGTIKTRGPLPIQRGFQFLSGRRDHTEPLRFRTTEPAYRLLCLTGAVLLLIGVGFAANPAAASESAPAAMSYERVAESDLPVAFDIPAQSLASALNAYGITTHYEVIYNGQLAVGRQSAAVKGNFTPEAALQLLLEGTGLLPHYMAADAFILVEDDRPLVAVNTAPPDVVISYYGRIQASLKRAFCANRRMQPGDYRVALGFRIGPSGVVSRAELLGSTGDHDLDAMIDNTVRGLVIGAPPPQGFAQPVILMVAPQSQGTVRDCDATGVQSAIKVAP